MVKIKELAKDNSTAAKTATEEDVVNFQNKNRISLPRDLIEYFRFFNGTSSEYNARWFCFYSLMEFQPLGQKFEEWIGIPNYQNIVKTLDQHENCYAFADYQCHLFTYAIRLYQIDSFKNEIYVVCGAEFRLIANTFTEFVEKYLDDSNDLQF